MRLIGIFLALSFLGQELFGQALRPSKTQLFKIFKSSINQDSKRSGNLRSDSWLIPNKDSSFYTSDTLYLYDVSNYLNRAEVHNYYIQTKNCCDFVALVFYRKTAFAHVEQNICAARAKVVTNKDFYTIAIVEENNQTIMRILQHNQLIYTFNVIAFDEVSLLKEGRATKRLKLVREKM
ncbi:hypothetical protein [Emticicia agri]|uniref:Uncharacterized protein n=1 Tax=Emticicia agri TaxID=2492393 RepID=A0A4Q5LYP6_9BACT|nr:hypothetical protein [Emticicia agri]RYU95001.1 hypothetical protein EWM59_14045 [Emticicia agri]